MKTENNKLIDELLTLTETSTEKVKKMKQLSDRELNFKETPEKWSVLECLEHLNRYGDFYLPEIEKSILKANANGSAHPFISGVIGNWFANLMKVKNGKIIKMKTPADKNPVGSSLTPITIDRFLKQQEMLRLLLNQARNVDLTRTKVPISLTKLLKLRLGDTLRFFVYHIERHVIQAEQSKLKV